MKRSLQEVVELVVFGLVALLVGTGLLWVVGWVLSLGGLLLKAVAGLLWLLLRFVVPVAIVAGLVYFIVKALQNRGESHPATATAGAAPAPQAPAAAPIAETPAQVGESAAPTPAQAEPSDAAGTTPSSEEDDAASDQA